AFLDQRLDLAQRATEHARDMRLLVAFGQLDRFAEVVFLEELRELGGELPRLVLRRAEIPPLLDHDREREDRHDRQHNDNPLRERAHRYEEVYEREIHLDDA